MPAAILISRLALVYCWGCSVATWVTAKHDIFAKFQVFYTVDKPSSDWRGGAGYISKDMVLKGLPGPGEDSLILVSSF